MRPRSCSGTSRCSRAAKLRDQLRWFFGAHGQLAVGAVTFAGAVAAWVYGDTLSGERLLRFIFHASMAALVIAAYAIVATALGYRATERVEAHVVENIEQVQGDVQVTE